MNPSLDPISMIYHGLLSMFDTQAQSEVISYKFTHGGRNVTVDIEGMPTIFMSEEGVSIGKDWTDIQGTKELIPHPDEGCVVVKQAGYQDKRIKWTSGVSTFGDSKNSNKEQSKEQSKEDHMGRDSY